MRLLAPVWLLALLLVPPLVLLTMRTLRKPGMTRGTASPPELLSTARRRAFLFLRVGAIVMLALGLAGLGFARLSDRLSVTFLLDQSRSVSEEQRAQAARVIAAVRDRLTRGDSASLVRFGADVQQETLMPGVPVSAEAGEVDGSATDIAGAIQYALAGSLGPGAQKIVLLTDGNENRGSAVAAAAVARSLGVKIYPVPLGTLTAAAPGSGRGEIAVEDIRAPDRVRQGEAQEVTVIVRSRLQTGARVTLFRDGQPIATREGLLAAGENAVQFTGVFPEQGLHAWDALIESPGDGISQNNHARRFVEVTGLPQVLYVTKTGHESPALLSALAAQGISVVERDVTGLPGTLAGFLPYDAIIFDDAPGYGISTEKMETIARYVRDAGGGLLMIGGENSFGAGGYYKTPIERVLPVDMDVKSEVQLPRLSLALVVDKSGSMGGMVPSGETKLDVVKSAALAAIESLNPFDRVALLAFDADWQWIVPLTNAGESEKIAADLASLVPGGGTILYPALAEAARVISGTTSVLRHVILISDGLTNPGDFESLVKSMAKEKITVSTVAVGEDADRTLLQNIAKWGGGRSYATDDPRDVPRIFMTETTLVSRGLLVEKSFLPRVVSNGESLRGISLEGMPALSGFVLTYAKSGAEVVLSALNDAPLLATWRYGLGRTAAFTSDFRGRWGTAWLSWDLFPRFVAQLVRWIERPSGNEVLHPRVELAGGKASVTVDAYDALGAFVDGLNVSGILLGPDGGRAEIRIPQTGPGLYEGRFDAGQVGDYLLTLSASSADTTLAPMTIGVSVPYSEEYRMLGVNIGLLDRLAAVTGGRVVSSAADESSLAEVLQREPGLTGTGDTAWRFLILAGLLLFFFDIVVRRLAVPAGLRERLAARLRVLRGRPGLSLEELAGMVTKAREEERAKLREKVAGITRESRVDPELAAYLYIARLRSRKAEEHEKEKGG